LLEDLIHYLERRKGGIFKVRKWGECEYGTRNGRECMAIDKEHEYLLRRYFVSF
jgi:hypothetical protein